MQELRNLKKKLKANKMGQRFQVVLITPKEYWNEGNGNNVEGRIKAYHFQWLWGDFAIWRLGQFLKGLKIVIKKEKEYCKNYGFALSFRELPEKVLNWICYKDLLSQNNFYDLGEQYLKNTESFEDFLNNRFDNNNGILLVKIDNHLKLSYCFYNPSDCCNEGTRQGKPLTAEEYLLDYKSESSDNGAGLRAEREYKQSLKEFSKVGFIKKLPRVESFMVKQEQEVRI